MSGIFDNERAKRQIVKNLEYAEQRFKERFFETSKTEQSAEADRRVNERLYRQLAKRGITREQADAELERIKQVMERGRRKNLGEEN